MRLWQWLRGWWKPRSAEAPVEVVLYTRHGCHLCADALRSLEASQRRHGFQFSVVDVDGDPALAREHGESVPVVMVAGKVRFRGRVNDVLLERLLRRS